MGGLSLTTFRKAISTATLHARHNHECHAYCSSSLNRYLGLYFLSLHLLGGLGEVGEGLTALELGVLNDTWTYMLVLRLIRTGKKRSIPASASEEKLAVHWTKVLFSFSPEVTA